LYGSWMTRNRWSGPGPPPVGVLARDRARNADLAGVPPGIGGGKPFPRRTPPLEPEFGPRPGLLKRLRAAAQARSRNGGRRHSASWASGVLQVVGRPPFSRSSWPGCDRSWPQVEARSCSARPTIAPGWMMPERNVGVMKYSRWIGRHVAVEQRGGGGQVAALVVKTRDSSAVQAPRHEFVGRPRRGATAAWLALVAIVDRGMRTRSPPRANGCAPPILIERAVTASSAEIGPEATWEKARALSSRK